MFFSDVMGVCWVSACRISVSLRVSLVATCRSWDAYLGGMGNFGVDMVRVVGVC